MNAETLVTMFESSFDVVGVISSAHYASEAVKRGKNVPDPPYPTLVVVGLAYPRRSIRQTEDHLVPSFYTFGSDYHVVLKNRIRSVMDPSGLAYEAGVDNHPHDERLAAVLAGLGGMGKNQLVINDVHGSYVFLGLVFIDLVLDREHVLEVTGDCGDCTRCIDACPTSALSDEGFLIDRCLSATNQLKRPVTDLEMDVNHALFGCDICQMVCPRNVGIVKKTHPEFELSGKEQIAVDDLFTLSNNAFKARYAGMSYMWKGKTVLMRNAVMLIARHGYSKHIPLIEASMTDDRPAWYLDTARRVIERLGRSF
jgi:epoxyqueuosine reductase